MAFRAGSSRTRVSCLLHLRVPVVTCPSRACARESGRPRAIVVTGVRTLCTRRCPSPLPPPADGDGRLGTQNENYLKTRPGAENIVIFFIATIIIRYRPKTYVVYKTRVSPPPPNSRENTIFAFRNRFVRGPPPVSAWNTKLSIRTILVNPQKRLHLVGTGGVCPYVVTFVYDRRAFNTRIILIVIHLSVVTMQFEWVQY